MLSILLVVYIIKCVECNWVTSPSTLPRADQYMAVGTDNGSIFLLGGYNGGSITGYPRQLVEYNIDDDIFIDYGVNHLLTNTWGSGQHYTQLQHIIYIIDPSGNKFSIFNMMSKEFVSAWSNITIPINVGSDSCLSSRIDHLFVVGGYNEALGGSLNIVQVLNIKTKEWISNIPSLMEGRESGSCIIHPKTNKLFAIGGYNNGEILSNIESININNMNNISQQSWQYFGSLTTGAVWTVSILWNNTILVIGGGDSIKPFNYIDTVNIINPINNKVILSSDTLSYKVCCTASIIDNNILYVFAGNNAANGYLKTWMKYILPPTPSPTISTNEPTTSYPSSFNPTTNMPTTIVPSSSNPTINPITTEPTTYSPTTTNITTTSYPSTFNPTTIISSSNNATDNPTINPTTIEPTTHLPSNTNIPITAPPSTNVTSNNSNYCTKFILSITNLDGISSQNVTSYNDFVSYIVNITRYSISIITNLDIASFYVILILTEQAILGELNVTLSVCSFTKQVFEPLLIAIENKTELIADEIKRRIVDNFKDNDDISTDNTMIIAYLVDPLNSGEIVVTITNNTEWIVYDGIQCDTFSHPNKSETECDFVAPWWLYVLCIVMVLLCMILTLYFKYSKLRNNKPVSNATTNSSMNNIEIELEKEDKNEKNEEYAFITPGGDVIDETIKAIDGMEGVNRKLNHDNDDIEIAPAIQVMDTKKMNHDNDDMEIAPAIQVIDTKKMKSATPYI